MGFIGSLGLNFTPYFSLIYFGGNYGGTNTTLSTSYSGAGHLVLNHVRHLAVSLFPPPFFSLAKQYFLKIGPLLRGFRDSDAEHGHLGG